MTKKFINLKDKQGNILYTSAYKDDVGQIIKESYVNKKGADHYLYTAWVEDITTSEGVELQKLVLIDRADPGKPIEFYTYKPDVSISVLYNEQLLNRIEILEQKIKELECK